MSNAQYQSEDRALTPVIGIILLVSITVLLAATTAAFVLGLEDDSVQGTPPTVAMDFDYDASGSDTLAVRHQTGGSLDPDQTYVVVEEASCSGADNPNGRYQARDDFGMAQNMAAGMSLAVTASLPGPTLCSGDLDLRSATVRLVWVSPDGRSSNTIATWFGPGT